MDEKKKNESARMQVGKTEIEKMKDFCGVFLDARSDVGIILKDGETFRHNYPLSYRYNSFPFDAV